MATHPTEADDRKEALVAAARRVRESGTLGHSAPLLRIFDFLTECSLAGRAAKESEIAVTVFDRSNPQEVVEDAKVRVYMYRLRKKLQEFYGGLQDDTQGQVAIPRGEYRLVYIPPSANREPVTQEVPQIEPEAALVQGAAARTWRVGKGALLIACGAAALFALGFATGRSVPNENTELARVRAAPIWSPIMESKRPISIVVGDFYLFGDSPDRATVTRLIREPAINSSEELDRELMANPDLIGHHIDLDVHAMPIAVAPALQRILPVLGTPREGIPVARTLAMSETSADRIKLSNIIYVGAIGGIGQLEEPLRRGAKAFPELAAHARAAIGRAGHEDDFAYVACFPGPNGNRIVIIAGLREAGLLQAAEIATNPAIIGDVARKAGSDNAFEAVFRVTAVGTTNFGAQLIHAGRIDTSKLWVR